MFNKSEGQKKIIHVALAIDLLLLWLALVDFQHRAHVQVLEGLMTTYMNKYLLGSEAKVCATVTLIKILHFDSHMLTLC